MQSRSRGRLVDVAQVLTLSERVEKNSHCADVESMRRNPQQVVSNSGNFREHDPDVLSANRGHHPKQFLYRQNIRMLVTHH